MNSLFSGLGGLDPSKMNPKAIAAMTELMGTLTHDQMMKLQSIMHNQMAGFDVSKEVIQLESSLPPSFREKMAKIAYLANGIDVPYEPAAAQAGAIHSSANQTVEAQKLETPATFDDARLVILQSVAHGLLTPEAAMKVLFKDNE